MENQTKTLYFKKGQVANAAIGSIIALVVGVGIITVIIIFIGILGGSTLTVSQTTLGNFTNTTMGNAVGSAVNQSFLNGFTTLQTTASYVPLIVLAVIIFIVLTLVLGFTSFSGGNGGMAGGAL